jgi:ectoine hydroxylase-related dioxygenase (phytanoyl-CoA dioxygenase family)
MSSAPVTARYGVLAQTTAQSEIDRAVESLRIRGYAVIAGGYDAGQLNAFAAAFEHAHAQAALTLGGLSAMAAVDEHNTIRAALAHDRRFLELASNPIVLQICRRLMADYIVLSQQNGVINPPRSERYNQGAWHRDLPYQHFVSSRPLAVNALFCLDPFGSENGATWVLPGSHRDEAFPSDHFIASNAITVEADAGSFILLDCMTFHAGGVNSTDHPRRAVNHVYTIPLMRQQIDLPRLLGDDFVSDPETRRLLGYDVRTPSTMAEFFESRQRRTPHNAGGGSAA